MGYETYAEGKITADGNEQTVTEITESVKFSGYISLSKLQDGDTVILRQYTKLFATWEKYAEEYYSDFQSTPVIYFTPKEIASSLRVTLEQTDGVFRTFEYKFVKETATVVIRVGGATFKV